MVDRVFPLRDTLTWGPKGPHRVKVHKPDLEFYHPRNNAFMPVEFSVAAYRYGHSMVRPIYRFNSQIGRVPIFSGNFAPNNLENLNGFRPLQP